MILLMIIAIDRKLFFVDDIVLPKKRISKKEISLKELYFRSIGLLFYFSMVSRLENMLL